MKKKSSQGRKPSTIEAVIIMTLVIVAILISLKASLELVPALLLGCIIASIAAMYLGYKWKDIEDGILVGINNGMGSVLILLVIGTVIGTWILGGTIPTLIYYGLNILTPNIFLPAAFILCSIVSVLIGSSFGTVATMGIVLMGVGEGLGLPAAMTAGAVVAGSIFGDKVSPMSDSTNLTAAMSGTPLFSHVKSMLYVSGPAVIISLILYYFIGKGAVSSSTDFTIVEQIFSTLDANFNITFLTMVPVFVIIIILALQTPAIPALVISYLVSAIFAMITQGATFTDIVNVTAVGFFPDTGFELIDQLLSQGGVASMMDTVSFILLGTAMGGILEKSQVLQAILDSLKNIVKTPRDLILATLAGGYLMLLATGEMFVSIIVPGRTLEPAYREMNVNTNVLSRSLETSATLACSVLPWGVVSVYVRGVLNIGFGYIKYTYLPFLAPIIAIIFAILGIATFEPDEEENINSEAELSTN